MIQKWRLAAVSLGAVFGCLVIIIAVVYFNRSDLRWLTIPVPESPAFKGKTEKKTVTPQVQVKARPATELNRERVLSTDGLKVAAYEGSNRLDQVIWETTGSLDADLLSGVKDLKDAVGLYPTAKDKIVIKPVSRTACSFTEPFQVTFSGEAYEIRLPVEPIALGCWKARDTISAALAVAILEREVPEYANAPSWLIYGIALNFSDLGYTWERRAVLDSDKAPRLLIRQLKDSGDLAWADGYWALRAFSARKGKQALFDWIEAMRTGASWQEALGKSSGESVDEFESEYEKWANSYLEQKCANRRLVMDQVAKLRLRQDKDVIPVLADFVENNPLDWYTGNARYFLNYARFRCGMYDSAIEGFSDLLLNKPESTTWQDKARYFFGRAYELSGYPPLAEKQFRYAALSDNPLLIKLARKRLQEVSH